MAAQRGNAFLGHGTGETELFFSYGRRVRRREYTPIFAATPTRSPKRETTHPDYFPKATDQWHIETKTHIQCVAGCKKQSLSPAASKGS